MKKILFGFILFILFGIMNVSASTKYRVDYVLSGGVNNPSNITEYESLPKSVSLFPATRTGYIFGGWYTDSELTNRVTYIPKGSKGNKTYYARWFMIKYSIIYDGNGATSGSTSNQTNLKYEDEYQLNDNGFIRRGYKFIGWNTKVNGKGTSYSNKATISRLTTENNGSVSLYAQWKIVSYGIKYELNGGTNNPDNPISYNVNTETITLKNPTRDGYTFLGWYSDKELTKRVKYISKGSINSKTLYAKWLANTYNIIFDGNGETSGSTSDQTNLKYDTTYELNSNGFVKRGYKFIGWNSKADGSGTTYTSVKNLTTVNNENITLYAKWKRVNYAIHYYLDGGKNNSNNPETYNVDSEEIMLRYPSKKGYTFAGWYTDAAFTNKNRIIPTGSINSKTFYAKWNINKYTITYVLYGGTNNKANPNKYTVETKVSLASPTMEGYTFGGWYSDKELTNRVKTISKGSTGNITLYAKWLLDIPSFSVTNSLTGEIKISSDVLIEVSRRNANSSTYELIDSGKKTITDNSVVLGETYYYVIRAIKYDEEHDNTIYSNYISQKVNARVWLWPTKTSYSISSPYGYRWGKLHSGVDIYVGGRGVPIYAARAGVVYSITSNSSSGFYVIIKHDDGYYTRYAHMQNTNGNDDLSGTHSATKYIAVGDRVEARQQIGEVGSSGGSTGPHLHFEIWDGVPFQGQSYDPLTFY